MTWLAYFVDFKLPLDTTPTPIINSLMASSHYSGLGTASTRRWRDFAFLAPFGNNLTDATTHDVAEFVSIPGISLAPNSHEFGDSAGDCGYGVNTSRSILIVSDSVGRCESFGGASA